MNHNRTILLSVFCVLFVVVSGLVWAGTPMTPRARKADKIIKKHVKASGGEANIRAIESLTIRGRLSRAGVELPFSLWMKRPGRGRMDIEIMGSKLIQAYDGKTAWWVNPLFGVFKPRKMPDEFAEPLLRWVEFESPLVDYLTKRHRAEYVGEEETPGGTAHVIKLRLVSGDVWHVYIDTRTYLETRRAFDWDYKGEVRRVETVFAGFETVEGVVFYKTIEGEGPDGVPYKMTFESIEPNIKTNDKHFEMN